MPRSPTPVVPQLIFVDDSHVSRGTIIFLALLLLGVGVLGVVLWPRGHKSITVRDVSRPFSASVHAPVRPFGSGAVYVLVEGRLDGDAALEVVSNRGRDRREVALRAPNVSVICGGAEDWVDDLQVHYRPDTAKTGQLYIALYCGTGFTPDDAARYNRISRSRP